MDKLFVRKDVYEELLEKGFGKKDYSKLTKKVITDKNGHRRTVFVKNGEQPAEVNQPKPQEGLSDEKKAKYEEMLEKVKAGPDENALFVRGKMLNKKDAIAHLEGKLGKKTVNSAAEGHLESDTPQNTDITKEDEERFGKQALSGLSGKRTSSEETEKKPSHDEIKTYKISDIERVDKNTLKLGDVSATKNWDNSWSIKNAQGEEVALALRMEDVKNAMLKSANRKPGETKFPNVSKDEKVATLANSFKGKYGRTEKEWKDAFNNAPEEILENRYEEYANKKK